MKKEMFLKRQKNVKNLYLFKEILFKR